jgi:hypothetical protein
MQNYNMFDNYHYHKNNHYHYQDENYLINQFQN